MDPLRRDFLEKPRKVFVRDILVVAVSGGTLGSELYIDCRGPVYERVYGTAHIKCENSQFVSEGAGVWRSAADSQPAEPIICRRRGLPELEPPPSMGGAVGTDRDLEMVFSDSNQCFRQNEKAFLVPGTSHLPQSYVLSSPPAGGEKAFESDPYWRSVEEKFKTEGPKNSLHERGTLAFWKYVHNFEDFSMLFSIDELPRGFRQDVCGERRPARRRDWTPYVPPPLPPAPKPPVYAPWALTIYSHPNCSLIPANETENATVEEAEYGGMYGVCK